MIVILRIRPVLCRSLKVEFPAMPETHTYALPRPCCRGHRDPNIHMVADTGVGVLCGNHVNTATCETVTACDR